MSDLAWDDLKYVLAIARTGSMQAAAKVLGVNQSTVQRRVAALEKALGRRLVERHLGSYRLTELGIDLQPALEGVETAVEAFRRQLAASDKGVTGILRLTCGPNLAGRLRRTSLLDAFHERHPGLRVELLISDRFLDLSKGEADIAVRRGEPSDEALVARKIADVTWSVYGSSSYIERHGLPKSSRDMSGHFVVGCDGPIANYPGAGWARSVAPPAVVAVRSDSWLGLMLAVKAGAGLAAMPRWQGDNETELVRVIDDVGIVMPYYLLMHRDMQRTPRVRAFADFVASEIQAFRAVLARGKGTTKR